MNRTISVMLVAFATCIDSWADLHIGGTVTDYATNETLPGAIVRIDGTHNATTTDADGRFTIEVNHPGQYRLVTSMPGYTEITLPVDIVDDNITDLLIKLRERREDLDEIVVSANRNAVRRREAPVVVNVLTPKVFDRVNSVDLAQTLNYQSGLRVENNCQNCGFPQVRINGLEGPYSQILINSRPVVSSLSGVYALEQMPVNMIERIEVVRGGGSALFGANAVAGTINVITKDPQDNHFETGTTISNMNGKAWEEVVTANATLTGDDSRYGIALYETYRHRSPYDADGDGFSEVGKLNLNSFGIDGYYRITPSARLGIEYHNTSEFRRGGNKFDLEPFQTDITEQTQHNINSGGLNFTKGWRDYKYRINVYASAQHIDRNSYYGALQNPDAYGKTTDMTWVTGATFTADIDRVLISPATFTAGVEYQANRLHDVMTGYGRDMRQNVGITGAFLQNEWRLRRFTLLAGLRLDNHNLIDNPILSPRINLLYRPSDKFQGRLTWSTGFRAPQAYDEDLHVTAVGGDGVIIRLADGLKPERSNSFSGSVDWDIPAGIFDLDILVEGFYTSLDHVFVLEAIGEDDNGTAIKERRNGNGARVYGANLDLSVNYGTLISLRTGFTLQRSRYTVAEAWSEDPDAAPTRRMPRTPDTYGYFTLAGKVKRNFDWSLSGIYTGRMLVPHFAPDHSEIPADYPYHYIAHDEMTHSKAFFELNAKISYDFHLSEKIVLQLNGGVQNIVNAFQRDLDKGAYRDSGYFYGPTQPRTYFVGLKIMSL